MQRSLLGLGVLFLLFAGCARQQEPEATIATESEIEATQKRDRQKFNIGPGQGSHRLLTLDVPAVSARKLEADATVDVFALTGEGKTVPRLEVADVKVTRVEPPAPEQTHYKVTLEVTPEQVLHILALQQEHGIELRPQAALARPARVLVLVAREDIPEWTALRDPLAHLEVKEVNQKDVPSAYVPPSAYRELSGRAVLKSIRKGQIACWTDIQDREKFGLEAIIPPGRRAFAIEIKKEAAARIVRGGHVDVLRADPAGKPEEKPPVLAFVLVLFIDLYEDAASITLMVKPEEALELATVKRDHSFLLRPVPLEQETYEVLVARADLAQWTPVREAGKLFDKKTLKGKETPPRFVPALASHELRDRALLKDVAKGKVLSWDDVQNRDKVGLEALLPPGKKAFVIATSARLETGGLLLPGAHVDVLQVTKKDGKETTQVIVADVLVRAVDLLPVHPEEKPGTVPSTITLEVTAEEFKKLEALGKKAELRLQLRPNKGAERGDAKVPTTPPPPPPPRP
ncbi:MAG: Flp pilus assembly protein CpaB [Gemmataceae bacterium]